MAKQYEWVKAKHPIYEKHAEDWARNEVRLAGDDEVLDELAKFDWEYPATNRSSSGVPEEQAQALAEAELLDVIVPGEDRWKARRAQAVYINFPDMLATTMVGHLMSGAPTPDFGALGKIAREEDNRAPSAAELVYYNVDGIGNDGSQWNNWWTNVTRRAMATGHRWILVDLPTEVPSVVTMRDAMAGKRPFLVELSPLSVTNWHYLDGVLHFAVIEFHRFRPRVEKGKLEGQAEQEFLVYVRRGFDDLDEGEIEFSAGGWWLFDKEADPVEREFSNPETGAIQTGHVSGTLTTFGDEIPLWPHFYERDPGTRNKPAISRSGTFQLGQAAVSYMNVESAAKFDFWDAAMSALFFLGVDPKNFNAIVRQARRGSRWMAVPPTRLPKTAADLEAPPIATPSIFDGSTGAVVAGVAKEILDRIVDVATRLASQEATGTPDSSGRSKEAGFQDIKSPRLALLAAEVEQSQNTAIHFLELGFGHDPHGQVAWPRKFNLLTISDHVAALFEMQKEIGFRSTRLDSIGLTMAAKERQIISTDEDAVAVAEEIQAAARLAQLGDIITKVEWAPGAAIVDIVMDVFRKMGLFVDENGQPKMVPGTTTPLEEAVLEAAMELAEAKDDTIRDGARLLEAVRGEPGENGRPPQPSETEEDEDADVGAAP